MTQAASLPAHEEPFFLQAGSERLFALFHAPAAPALPVSVLFCHALAEEKLWSHRVYVSFARECAAAGIATLRFDCRGEGDSDREFEASTVSTRVADVQAAARELARRAPGTHLVLVGHRFGGALAAVAAAEAGVPVAGIVIWDPLPDVNDYFGTLLRSNLATQLAVQGKVTRTREVLIEELQAGTPVVVDGYAFTRDFHAELARMNWLPALQALPRGALLVEVKRGEQAEPSAPLRAVIAESPAVRGVVVTEPPFWRETKQFHRAAPNFSAATLEWLRSLT